MGPVKRRDLIRRLKMLGWRGPIPSRHDFMVLGARKVHIPNVKEIDAGLLRVILNELGISRDEWFSTD
ncbi:MAG: type II toxin-antitoxin system HicA family toxin [Acidimicrobiaceae bacterium]|nr:type II toxin-antitoxin system HicA family toxin [Acidimicrobiaceae bacterium]